MNGIHDGSVQQAARCAHNGGVRRLPPFDSLVAFEAVARHGSATQAAAELCITQSAVSHRIRKLEAHFGVKLVQRGTAKLELTGTGRAMLPQVVGALDHLSALGRTGEHRLRVAAGTALSTWWLASRLPKFMAQRPGLSIELATVDTVDSRIPEVDVRILWLPGDGDPERPRQASLFTEAVFPVCSPSLLPQGRPLADARHILDFPLLHKASNDRGEWSWSIWREHLCIDSVEQPRATLSFADMGLVMSAAVEGAGIALTRSLLAHDALADGRLVPALAQVAPMPSSKHHVARWPRAKDGDRAMHDFVEWIVEEARATLASTNRMVQFPVRAVEDEARPRRGAPLIG